FNCTQHVMVMTFLRALSKRSRRNRSRDEMLKFVLLQLFPFLVNILEDTLSEINKISPTPKRRDFDIAEPVRNKRKRKKVKEREGEKKKKKKEKEKENEKTEKIMGKVQRELG